MALTRWLDPNNPPNDLWTIAHWTDTDLIVLMFHVWPSIKAATDERLAFSLRTQSSGFPINRNFPSFEDEIITDVDVNLYDEMIWPEDVPQWENIQTSGTFNAVTSPPGLLSIEDYLQDVEGYASQYLLVYLDTDFKSKTAMIKWPWAIQLYQVLNYPQYYERRLWTTGDHPFLIVQKQVLFIFVEYDYNTPSSFTKGRCLRGLNGVNTDIYVANDLNESAPMSTPQQVKDYTVAQFDAEFAALGDADWQTVGSLINSGPYGSSYEDRISHFTGHDRVEYNNRAEITRYRFKTIQEFRADNTRYDSDYYVNYYFTGHNDPYVDFGTGKTDQDVEFVQLTADGNDNFVLEIPNPDYSNAGTGAPPALPPVGTPLVTAGGAIFKEFINTTGQAEVVYARPNKIDGTGYLFYTEEP